MLEAELGQRQAIHAIVFITQEQRSCWTKIRNRFGHILYSREIQGSEIFSCSEAVESLRQRSNPRQRSPSRQGGVSAALDGKKLPSTHTYCPNRGPCNSRPAQKSQILSNRIVPFWWRTGGGMRSRDKVSVASPWCIHALDAALLLLHQPPAAWRSAPMRPASVVGCIENILPVPIER